MARQSACRPEWTEGEDRPRCSRHEEPMRRRGYNGLKQRWCCSVNENRIDANLRAIGLCTRCWNNPLHNQWLCSVCREKQNAQRRAQYPAKYDAISGFEHNRLLLKRRRTKALARKRLRHERLALDG